MKQIFIKKLIILIIIGTLGVIIFMNLKSKFSEFEKNVLKFKNKVDSLEKIINETKNFVDTLIVADNSEITEPNASFSDSILSNDGKKVKVQFSALFKDADKYQWFFGDNISSKDNKSIQNHTYSLSNQKSFKVILIVTKNNITEADTLEIKFSKKEEPLDASFEYKLTENKNYLMYKFRAKTRDADNYKWYIDNKLLADNKLPDFLYTYKINETKQFYVKLIIKKGDKSNEYSKEIAVDILQPPKPDARFSFKFNDLKTFYEYNFTAYTRDADNFKWYVNDTLLQNSKAPDFKYKIGFTARGIITVKLSLTKENKDNFYSMSVKTPKETPKPLTYSFKLKNNEHNFCFEDNTSYEFETTPGGGKITRNDGVKIEPKNGIYYFIPSNSNSKINKIIFFYKINDTTLTYKVEILNPDFTYAQVKNNDTNKTNMTNAPPVYYKFEAVTNGCDKYIWKFSNISKDIPQKKLITIPLNQSDIKKGINVTLEITKNGKKCEKTKQVLK